MRQELKITLYIPLKDRNKKEKLLKSKNLIFSANAVLDESGVSPVYLAAQEGHLEVMMTIINTTLTHNDDIPGASVPGQPGGGRGRAAGPGKGRHGPAARRRPDGLPGLPQVDGQGTNMDIRSLLIIFIALKH